MNDSTVRIHADMIAGNLQSIAGIASQLRRSYDILYDQLKTADPRRDRKFECFMLHLTRTLHALESENMSDLAASTAEMRNFISAPAVSDSAVGRAVPVLHLNFSVGAARRAASAQVGRASREPSAPPVVAARRAASAPVGRAVPPARPAPCEPSAAPSLTHQPLADLCAR